MGKSSWKKSLIKTAHTFLDYVVAWRGFGTEDVSIKKSSNTWVVPQKATEVPQQNQEYFDAWYNLPYLVGYSGSSKRYRYPANNRPYENLDQYQTGNVNNQCVKVDYRNGSQNYNFNRAGLNIGGWNSNRFPYSSNNLGQKNNGNTVWQTSLYGGLYNSYAWQNVKGYYSGTTFDYCVANKYNGKLPFGNVSDTWNVANLVGCKQNTFVSNASYQQFGCELDTELAANGFGDYYASISFYVCLDFTSENYNVSEQPNENQSGTSLYSENLRRVQNSDLAFRFASTEKEFISGNFNEPIKTGFSTYLSINPADKSYEIYTPDSENGYVNNPVISYVNFEDCPNNYVRVSVFFNSHQNREYNFRYVRMFWSTKNIGEKLEDYCELWNGEFAYPLSRTGLTTTLWGWSFYTKSYTINQITPFKKADWLYGDYISNNSEVISTTSFTQLRLPNLYLNLENYERCKTIYFKFWSGCNINPNNTLLGAKYTGGNNFCFLNYDTPILPTQNSNYVTRRVLITQGLNQQSLDYRYVLWLDANGSANTNLTRIEGKSYIYLKEGFNSIAMTTGGNKIYVNGKEYSVSGKNLTYNMEFIQFNGKRNDYLAEYGLWEEVQPADVLKQLTEV